MSQFNASDIVIVYLRSGPEKMTLVRRLLKTDFYTFAGKHDWLAQDSEGRDWLVAYIPEKDVWCS